MDEMAKGFIDSINAIPPIMRYPALLTLAELVAEELPKAEAEYNNEKVIILERFFEVIDRIHSREE